MYATACPIIRSFVGDLLQPQIASTRRAMARRRSVLFRFFISTLPDVASLTAMIALLLIFLILPLIFLSFLLFSVHSCFYARRLRH